MSPTPKYSRQDVKDAVQLVKSGSSVNNAAKKYKIPETSLRNIIKTNNLTHETDISHNQTVLTKKEELDLYNWILECSKAGFPRSTRQILHQAYQISVKFPRLKHFPTGRPSHMWLRRFLKRCGNLHRKKIVHISTATSSVNEVNIRAYHNRVTTYLKENGLYHILFYPDRVGNADESYLGFLPRQTTVLIDKNQQKGKKTSKMDPKTHLTVLFTALANGNLMDSYIVYPYERVPREIREGFPKDSMCFGKSESGWMNGELFLHYLENVVVKHLETNQVKRPFILFVDGHSSHLGLEVIEYCKLQDIILITLYPNATWLIQPLDVGVFGPLKTMWDAFLLDKDNNMTFVVNYRSFAHVFKEFIDEKAKFLAPFITKSFEDSGIFPWNCDAIKFETLIESCRMRKDVPGKELMEENQIITIEELDTDLNMNDDHHSLTDNQSDIIDPSTLLMSTDLHDACNQPENITISAPSIEQGSVVKDNISNLRDKMGVINDISVFNEQENQGIIIQNSELNDHHIMSACLINNGFHDSSDQIEGFCEIIERDTTLNGDNLVIELENTDMMHDFSYTINHTDNDNRFPSSSKKHQDCSVQTEPIYIENFQPTDKEKNKYVIETVLKHCESEKFKQDLLNGTVDRNKKYGVDSTHILMKIIQNMKEPESARDLLPLVPPVFKKTNMKKRLRPEVLVSAENIEEEKRVKRMKIEALKSKEEYAEAKAMKNQKLHELRMQLTDFKYQGNIIVQEIRRLNQQFKTKGHGGLSPDEFKQKQEELNIKKNEIFLKIDQTKIDIKNITPSRKSNKENLFMANTEDTKFNEQ
uniref:CSON006128 protein n=1 Tax=Culicoides sonorensis TaxID=179676 RepID=A0A336L8N8_CULSO